MHFHSKHPLTLAAEIAAVLKADPVTAAQIKEYIPPKQLGELLDIKTIEVAPAEQNERCLLLTTDRVIAAFGFWEIFCAYVVHEWHLFCFNIFRK